MTEEAKEEALEEPALSVVVYFRGRKGSGRVVWSGSCCHVGNGEGMGAQVVLAVMLLSSSEDGRPWLDGSEDALPASRKLPSAETSDLNCMLAVCLMTRISSKLVVK